MGKNRPDHLLQDGYTVFQNARGRRPITAQWLFRLDGVVLQRVNPLLNITQWSFAERNLHVLKFLLLLYLNKKA